MRAHDVQHPNHHGERVCGYNGWRDNNLVENCF